MRVVVRQQMSQRLGPREIEGDTDEPFGLTYKEITETPCKALMDVFIETSTYRAKVLEAAKGGSREVSFIILKGSNFNADVREVLEYLSTLENTLLSELHNRCGYP